MVCDGTMQNYKYSYVVQQMRNLLLPALQSRVYQRIKSQIDRIDNHGFRDPKYVSFLLQAIGLLLRDLKAYPNAPKKDGSATTQGNAEHDLEELESMLRLFVSAPVYVDRFC